MSRRRSDYTRKVKVVHTVWKFFKGKMFWNNVYNKDGTPNKQALYFSEKIIEVASELSIPVETYLYAMRAILEKTSSITWRSLVSDRAKSKVTDWMKDEKRKKGLSYIHLSKDFTFSESIYREAIASVGEDHAIFLCYQDLSEDFIQSLIYNGKVSKEVILSLQKK